MVLTKMIWQNSLLRLGWASQRQDGDLGEERAQRSLNSVWSMRESLSHLKKDIFGLKNKKVNLI